jgi:predicted RNA-binding Zn-ribbon protein involved in translation (DUF1610 family)
MYVFFDGLKDGSCTSGVMYQEGCFTGTRVFVLLYNTNKSYKISNPFHSGDEDVAEFEVPFCDNNHDGIQMRRVWTDGRGNAVYQCPACGRKMQARDGDGRR